MADFAASAGYENDWLTQQWSTPAAKMELE
jgi:hypothetical protein